MAGSLNWQVSEAVEGPLAPVSGSCSTRWGCTQRDSKLEEVEAVGMWLVYSSYSASHTDVQDGRQEFLEWKNCRLD